MQLIEEEFEVTDNNKLSLPALLNAARLGHLDVALVGRTNTPGGVDAQRPFCLIRGHGAGGRHPVLAPDVAGKATHLAHHPLAGQTHHQGGAVVALQRRGETPEKLEEITFKQ